MNQPGCLLEKADIANKIQRIACEIKEQHANHRIALVGIHTRGVVFANRIYDQLKQKKEQIEYGSIDISLYRDDLNNLKAIPSIKGSDIPFTVDGAHIILFDDVLFTGRTIRAAIDVLIDYGRPARIELAVLIDRGNRELPIAPDYTGHVLQTKKEDHIKVCFEEVDEKEGVYVVEQD